MQKSSVPKRSNKRFMKVYLIVRKKFFQVFFQTSYKL